MSDEEKAPQDTLKVCGVVMPISAIKDKYDLEHWQRVRKIIETAIKKSRFQTSNGLVKFQL